MPGGCVLGEASAVGLRTDALSEYVAATDKRGRVLESLIGLGNGEFRAGCFEFQEGFFDL